MLPKALRLFFSGLHVLFKTEMGVSFPLKYFKEAGSLRED